MKHRRAPPARFCVALVLKRSTWQTYAKRNGARVRRLLSEDESLRSLRDAHEAHERTVTETKAALRSLGVAFNVVRDASRAFDTDDVDLVVTVGGDGTLLSASHSVGRIPMLGINSAPSHSVGFFCGARSGEVARALAAAVHGRLPRLELTRMQVKLNGRIVSARILNDALFCHRSPAATSRYVLRLRGIREEQRSSGFWIGPSAGSTAAQHSAGGRILPLTSNRLQLVVREAFRPHGEVLRLRHALIDPGETLAVRSKMRDAQMFFDGPSAAIDVDLGDLVEFTKAREDLTLFGLPATRRWAAR